MRAKRLNAVNRNVYVKQVSVQVRVPETLVREIDRWVREGRFRSRSDAIKTVLTLYQEQERIREFYRMLVERSEEARKNPRILIPLGELK
jgi:Arc/MetJ-type ribon-helix-helix transcriptional regulator